MNTREPSPETALASRRARFVTHRRWLKLIPLAAAGIGCFVWLGMAIHHGFTHVSANDARVMANEVTVSSRLAGWVTDFPVSAGDRLQRGAPVARLDHRPDQRQLETLAAAVEAKKVQLSYEQQRLALSQQQLEGGIEIAGRQLKASRAGEAAAKARMVQASKDLERARRLFKKGSISKQQRDQDYYAFQAAQAEYDEARQQVTVEQSAADNARLGFLDGMQLPLPNPDVLRAQLEVARQQLAEARARLAQQKLRLHDLTVRSPVTGTVDRTFIDAGEYVSAGQPIVMMHDPKKLWVEADMKETSIADLRTGQPVKVTVDAYPNHAFSGHVVVIGRAATSEFALLPDPNPSGNFTKITQRIPVRIALDDGPLNLLGPGMMVEVDIDVGRDTTG